MAWFSKKDKKKEKRGWFGKNKHEELAEEDKIVEDIPEEEEELSETEEIIEEIEQEHKSEEEEFRRQAEEALSDEARLEAQKLARMVAGGMDVSDEDEEASSEEQDESVEEESSEEQEEPAEEESSEEQDESVEEESSEEQEEPAEEESSEEQDESVEEESSKEQEESAEEEVSEEQEESVEEEVSEEQEESVEEEVSEEQDESAEEESSKEQEESVEEGVSEEQEESVEEVAKPEKKKNIFSRIRDGLRKTKDAMVNRMRQALNGFTKIDDDLFDELEEIMIMSDMGPETAVEICDLLRQRVKERGETDPNVIMDMIQEIITEMLGEDQELTYPTKPTIVTVIGVNGAGKTTTIGKLSHQLKDDGKKVLVAAADTFRAAAIDQLEVWTQRAGVDIVKHTEGSDPGAVIYDGIAAAKARGCDVLICDTAGRLHNKKNLMAELAKINRIIDTQAEGCHRETLLVLDATTGQNAVNQARLFQEVADISGIVLTKLDGTAKGGIIVSIHNELKIPVKLIGIGEKIDDLQPFHAKDFVQALFETEEEVAE